MKKGIIEILLGIYSLGRVSHNVWGLAQGWTFLTSGPELLPNKVTKVDGANQSPDAITSSPEPKLIRITDGGADQRSASLAAKPYVKCWPDEKSVNQLTLTKPGFAKLLMNNLPHRFFEKPMPRDAPAAGLHLTARALCRLGISIPSAHSRC